GHPHVKRHTNGMPLGITGIALSAASCGGSTPSVTAPAATAASPPRASAIATPSVATASRSVASASPSAAAATMLSWTFGGSLPPGWTEEDGAFSRSECAYVEHPTDRSLMSANCVLGPQPGIGHTAADIVGALSRRPGLATTGADDITVAGLAGPATALHLP